MKKLFLCAAIAVFGLSNVNAQEVKFGAKAGVNFASLSGDDADGLDGRTTFHIGGVVRIGISEKFAVQPELVYSSQGFTFSEFGIDVTGKLDYINLPIMADFTVAEGFSLQAGPQIGFNITDKVEAEGESESLDAESIDFGLALGAQFKMETGLFFQARYAMGLSDVASDGDIKNSVLSVSVGFFF
jgi:hypothetical protein